MTPDPTLTDEELAEMRAKLYHRATCQNQPWNDYRDCSCGARERFDRLIAALMASREEIADLNKQIDDLKLSKRCIW